MQVTGDGERVLKGAQMKSVKVLNAKPNDGLSIVVNRYNTRNKVNHLKQFEFFVMSLKGV